MTLLRPILAAGLALGLALPGPLAAQEESQSRSACDPVDEGGDSGTERFKRLLLNGAFDDAMRIATGDVEGNAEVQTLVETLAEAFPNPFAACEVLDYDPRSGRLSSEILAFYGPEGRILLVQTYSLVLRGEHRIVRFNYTDRPSEVADWLD